MIGAATVVAGVVYSAFVVMPLLGTPLDPARSYVSELAASGQPYGLVLRVVDALVAAVVVVAGLYLARRGGVPAVRWAGAALGFFGAATLVDAAAPMACAPSVDAACAAADASRGPLAFEVHELSSVTANGAAVLAVVLLVAARRRGRTAGETASPFEGVLLVGLPLVAVPGLLVVGEETLGLGIDAVVGYVQRVQVLALSAVLAAVGLAILRGSRWIRS